jgi:hypothetical protein
VDAAGVVGPLDVNEGGLWGCPRGREGGGEAVVRVPAPGPGFLMKRGMPGTAQGVESSPWGALDMTGGKRSVRVASLLSPGGGGEVGGGR